MATTLLSGGRACRAAACVMACVLLAGCEALLFYPQKKLIRSPADVGLEYRDVAIPVADSQLHGWWLPAKRPRASLLFAHGNAENISTHLASVYWLPAKGVNVLLVDYRGYGQSPGRPSVATAVADVAASWQWLLREQGDLPLFGLGQSLGASLITAGTAQEAAALQDRLAGLVIDAGFSRYADIAREQSAKNMLSWPLQWPLAWSMPDGFDAVTALAQLPPAPLLVVHGRQDTVVAPHHATRLYDHARQPKSLYLYNGGHIESFERSDARQRLLAFIDQAIDRFSAQSGEGLPAPGRD